MSFLKSVILAVILGSSRLEAFTNFADVGCGKPGGHREGKIVGGNEALKGEFPWLVSLTRRGGHFCGGTIISNKYVLTAGHCLCTGIDNDFIKPGSLKITISQHDLTESNTDAYQVGVKAITVHPGYTCQKPSNDIALVELEKELEWSDSVSPACLPASKEDRSHQSFDDVQATVAGWGWTHEKNQNGGRADRLQKAKVNVIDMNTCQEWYKSQGKKVKLQPTQMCAGHKQGGIDACWADSGGPLMVKAEEATMVVGVVSTGIGCARPFLPGLYTRISEYIPWMQDSMKNH